jgi:hypothetical protein
MKHVLSTLALAAASLITVSAAQAQAGTPGSGGGGPDQLWRAVAAGPLESPPNASPGSSITTVELSSGNLLLVDAPFKDLEGASMAAHIHCCTTQSFTGIAPIAVPFTGFPTGVMSGDYLNAIDLTSEGSFQSGFLSGNGGTASSATSALLAGINANEAYVNIHTNRFPNGEIRGWLVAAPIPEPATWAMLGMGLAGLGFMARRKA